MRVVQINSIIVDLEFVFSCVRCLLSGVAYYSAPLVARSQVPNLFAKDDLAVMCAELGPIAAKALPGFVESPDALHAFFIDRVQRNLHLALCMSPVNPRFPERARCFPGLVSGTTCDWFLPWPQPALVAVARSFIDEVRRAGVFARKA